MLNPNDVIANNASDEKNVIHIIKYCSQNFDNPLYLIWYTNNDENATDCLLTLKTGDIFTAKPLVNLKKTIVQEKDSLSHSDYILRCLDGFDPSENDVSCTYDLNFILSALTRKDLEIPTIEGFSTFINLYDDFIHQDDKNNHLKIHRENILIKEVWDYYYEYIFWPRFNDKDKFEAWNRPPLVIDTEQLIIKFKEVIDTFERRLKL